MKALTEQEIKVTGMEALNKALGLAGTHKFLTLLHHEPTDYVEISRRLFEGKSAEEIFKRGKAIWKAKHG